MYLFGFSFSSFFVLYLTFIDFFNVALIAFLQILLNQSVELLDPFEKLLLCFGNQATLNYTPTIKQLGGTVQMDEIIKCHIFLAFLHIFFNLYLNCFC